MTTAFLLLLTLETGHWCGVSEVRGITGEGQLQVLRLRLAEKTAKLRSG